jgi:hypothetical protein
MSPPLSGKTPLASLVHASSIEQKPGKGDALGFLYAANENGKSIVTFAVAKASGRLTPMRQGSKAQAPAGSPGG